MGQGLASAAPREVAEISQAPPIPKLGLCPRLSFIPSPYCTSWTSHFTSGLLGLLSLKTGIVGYEVLLTILPVRVSATCKRQFTSTTSWPIHSCLQRSLVHRLSGVFLAVPESLCLTCRVLRRYFAGADTFWLASDDAIDFEAGSIAEVGTAGDHFEGGIMGH